MYYANCEWYVDMGEHNKPLCKRRSLQPAKCSKCPVYIRSIEAENAKLRKYVNYYMESIANGGCEFCPYEEDPCDVETYPMHDGCALYEEMRRLGIGMDDESV